MRQLRSNPMLSFSGSGHTGKQTKKFDAVIHVQECPPHKRFFPGCSSPFTRLAEHLTFRYLALAMSACSVESRRAPSVPA